MLKVKDLLQARNPKHPNRFQAQAESVVRGLELSMDVHRVPVQFAGQQFHQHKPPNPELGPSTNPTPVNPR